MQLPQLLLDAAERLHADAEGFAARGAAPKRPLYAVGLSRLNATVLTALRDSGAVASAVHSLLVGRLAAPAGLRRVTQLLLRAGWACAALDDEQCKRSAAAALGAPAEVALLALAERGSERASPLAAEAAAALRVLNVLRGPAADCLKYARWAVAAPSAPSKRDLAEGLCMQLTSGGCMSTEGLRPRAWALVELLCSAPVVGVPVDRNSQPFEPLQSLLTLLWLAALGKRNAPPTPPVRSAAAERATRLLELAAQCPPREALCGAVLDEKDAADVQRQLLAACNAAADELFSILPRGA